MLMWFFFRCGTVLKTGLLASAQSLCGRDRELMTAYALHWFLCPYMDFYVLAKFILKYYDLDFQSMKYISILRRKFYSRSFWFILICSLVNAKPFMKLSAFVWYNLMLQNISEKYWNHFFADKIADFSF